MFRVRFRPLLSIQYSVLSTWYWKRTNRRPSLAFVGRRLPTIAVLVALTGCSTSGDFPTAATSGRVICEGQPVPHVMVHFEPIQEGKAGLVGKGGFAIARPDGTFTISTYGTEDGAVVGKHRVRVGRPHPGEHPNFKCACYINEEVDLMEVEVKKGQKNEFELVLRKRTAQDPAPRRDD
jgi:hypothetical protein